jgi:hypothetical protein
MSNDRLARQAHPVREGEGRIGFAPFLYFKHTARPIRLGVSPVKLTSRAGRLCQNGGQASGRSPLAPAGESTNSLWNLACGDGVASWGFGTSLA